MPNKYFVSLSIIKSSSDDLLTMKSLWEYLNFKPLIRTRNQKIAKPVCYTAGPDTQQMVRTPIEYQEFPLRPSDDESAQDISSI